MREGGRLVAPDRRSLGHALEAVEGRPLYLTVDLDVFDPAFLPGTGTPEPGGVDWRRFEGLLSVLPFERVAGCDVVELAPGLDTSGASSVLAAKVVRELLVALPRG